MPINEILKSFQHQNTRAWSRHAWRRHRKRGLMKWGDIDGRVCISYDPPQGIMKGPSPGPSVVCQGIPSLTATCTEYGHSVYSQLLTVRQCIDWLETGIPPYLRVQMYIWDLRHMHLESSALRHMGHRRDDMSRDFKPSIHQ